MVKVLQEAHAEASTKDYRQDVACFCFPVLKKRAMDSINREQPEKNREDLGGAEAVRKMRELCEKAGTCFFCTAIRSGEAFATRPMSVQELDEAGVFWFLSATDSHKNAQLAADPKVQLLFQGSSHSDFISLYGTATISQDKEKIKALWSPLLKTWFTEGIDDPRISVIRVVPEHGYYWDTKHNQMIAFAKQLIGAATGQTLDDSIEGTLRM